MKRTLILLVAVLALVGCTGVPAPTYCFQVASATIHTVDLGMNVAGDLYRDKVINDDVKGTLVAAHNVYRPAAQAAVAACKAVQDQGSADKVVADLQTAADRIIAALVAAGAVH